MQTCANDWTPVITVIAIQIPVLIGLLGTWLTTRVQTEKIRSAALQTQTKVDALTTITVNGFKSPHANVDNLPQ